jgi:DNA-directed RNA polymerase I subunit RPA2
MVASFDPLAPQKATSSKFRDKSTFGTLTRERMFRHPSKTGQDFDTLTELVRPHVESFDALTEGSEDGTPGLLQLGIEDIGEKVVFDGVPAEGLPFGTKITCG